MSDIRCQMSDVKCQMSDVRCQMSDVRCQISDVRCQMSDVRCQMSDVRCQMSDVRYQMSDVSHRDTNKKDKQGFQYMCVLTAFSFRLPAFVAHPALFAFGEVLCSTMEGSLADGRRAHSKAASRPTDSTDEFAAGLGCGFRQLNGHT
jgi:hypothetical protein